MVPRLVWITQDLSSHNDKYYIHTSEGISTHTRLSPGVSWSSSHDLGKIKDLKTFFNESDQSSFYMTTNGSVIYMIPIALNDRKNNGTRVVANKRSNDFHKFKIFRTAASAFRYKNIHLLRNTLNVQ